MKPRFKIGEKVRFLHEKQEGVIQKILSTSKVEVLVDDFIEIEVHVDELVGINRSEKLLVGEPEEQDAPAAPVSAHTEASPSLVLCRNNQNEYELHLVNPGADTLLFHVFSRKKSKARGIGAGECDAGENRAMGRVSVMELHGSGALVCQLIRFREGNEYKTFPPAFFEFSIKKDIAGENPVFIPQLDRDGIELILEEAQPEPEEMIVEDGIETTENRDSDFPDIVDLHIENLIDNAAGISGEAMLRIQMERFERVVTGAYAKGAGSIVLIHGIGNGHLKREIHQHLKNYAFVRHFELADPMKYGNGATKVYFQSSSH